MIHLVPQATQRHDRVGHRRIDSSQPAVTLHPLEHPLRGACEGLLAEPLWDDPLVESEDAIQADEEVVPSEPAASLPGRGLATGADQLTGRAAELVDALLFRAA